MLFVPVVTCVRCAGKWPVPRGRTALVYSFVLYGSFVVCVGILCRSDGSLSSLNKSGNVCCLVASGICQPALGSPSVLQRSQTEHGSMLLYSKFRNRFQKNSVPHCRFPSEFCFVLYLSCYGLDDPGVRFLTRTRDFFHFHISLKPAQGTTKSPIQWVLGVLYLGVKRAGVMKLAIHLLLVQRLGMNGPVPLLRP